jgi:NIMA (never in mitosis gene a)-related kinase
MERYDRATGRVLGKGSFGTAVLVTCKTDGKKYVIKEIDISRMPKAEREAAELEATVRKPLLFAVDAAYARHACSLLGSRRTFSGA